MKSLKGMITFTLFIIVLCLTFTRSGLAVHKVGFVAAITGPASFIGQPEKEAALMVQEWINAAGGIKGVPIELIIVDTKGVEADALLAAKRLIETDKVLLIIGASTTGESMAMIPICEKAETPMISMGAALSIVTPEDEMKRMEASEKPWLEVPKKQRYWIFKTTQNDADAIEKIYSYCRAKRMNKVAIMTVSTGFGVEGRKQLKRLAPKYGIEIVSDELYGPKDTDMTAQLTKIKASPAQVVINWTIGPSQIIVTKNWHDLGMRGKIPLIQSYGFGNKENIRLAGPAAEGVLAPLGLINYVEKANPTHPQRAVTLKLKTDYENRYKKEVPSFAILAHDALMIAVDAIKAVGPDKKKIRDYIENNIRKWPGVGGIFNMSPTDHTGVGMESFEIIEVVRGDWELAK